MELNQRFSIIDKRAVGRRETKRALDSSMILFGLERRLNCMKFNATEHKVKSSSSPIEWGGWPERSAHNGHHEVAFPHWVNKAIEPAGKESLTRLSECECH